MADKKYRDFNAANEVKDADVYLVSQDKGGGAFESVKVTMAQVLSWIRGHNDGRYVNGKAGADGGEFRTNQQNDSRFRKQSDNVPIGEVSGAGTAAGKDINNNDGGDGNHVLTKGSYGVGKTNTTSGTSLDFSNPGILFRNAFISHGGGNSKPQNTPTNEGGVGIGIGESFRNSINYLWMPRNDARAFIGHVSDNKSLKWEELSHSGNLKQSLGSSKDYPMSQDGATKAFAQLAGGSKADFSSMPRVSGSPIVERGSSSKGEWTIWADGTAEVRIRTGLWGSSDDITKRTLEFPITFSANPICFHNAEAGTASQVNQTVSSITTDSCEIIQYRTSSTNIVSNILAKGVVA